MSDTSRWPTDATLSEADVKRVLERAAQIDGGQTAVTVSDLTQAAREAGISETAVRQAVLELLQDRALAAPAASGTAVSADATVRPRLWLLRATFAFFLIVAVMAVFFFLRITP